MKWHSNEGRQCFDFLLRFFMFFFLFVFFLLFFMRFFEPSLQKDFCVLLGHGNKVEPDFYEGILIFSDLNLTLI